MTWCPGWTLQVWLAVQISSVLTSRAREHSQLTRPLRSPSLPTCLLCSTRLFGFSKDRNFWGGEAEYFYLNCGCDLSSLSSGSLSKLGHIHVTHACLRSRIRCLACCPSLPPGQGAAAVGVGEVGALCSWTHMLPMCPQLSWTWAGL